MRTLVAPQSPPARPPCLPATSLVCKVAIKIKARGGDLATETAPCLMCALPAARTEPSCAQRSATCAVPCTQPWAYTGKPACSCFMICLMDAVCALGSNHLLFTFLKRSRLRSDTCVSGMWTAAVLHSLAAGHACFASTLNTPTWLQNRAFVCFLSVLRCVHLAFRLFPFVSLVGMRVVVLSGSANVLASRHKYQPNMHPPCSSSPLGRDSGNGDVWYRQSKARPGQLHASPPSDLT